MCENIKAERTKGIEVSYVIGPVVDASGLFLLASLGVVFFALVISHKKNAKFTSQ